MFKDMDLYSQVAVILVLIGGICWGLAGLFNFYLVTGLLGEVLGRIVYIIVGISAGWLSYKIYVDKMKKS